MDYFRAGKRKLGGGIQEKDVGAFVMSGGVGALVGGLTMMHITHDQAMIQGMAATAMGIGVGHMLGHELARRQIDS